MKLTDARGLPVWTQSARAPEHYELAARQTYAYFGNPLATLDEALANDPDFAMAHALRADLAVMSSEQGALPLIYAGMDARGLNACDPWADSALSFHNWWNLALHHLELDDITSALDDYDRLVHPKPIAVALELVDASQLLARDEGGFYAFNDVHALIAYTAAGRDEHQRRMLAKLEKSADGVHINANITRELGLPPARAIVAMASGRHAEAVELLLPVHSRMNRIGGSHAQRDLVQLTGIEATLRCGNGRLARALVSERTEQKPTSPFNWELAARALDVSGDAAAAKPVRKHALLRRRAQLRRNAA